MEQDDTSIESPLPDEAYAPRSDVALHSAQSGSKNFLRRLLGGTFHYGLGDSVPQLVRFLLIPVFTFFLTPAEYGILDLAVTLGGFLNLTMRFGVPGAVTRFYFEYREGTPLRDYVTTVAWFMLGSSLTITALMLAAGPWIISAWIPGLDYWPFGVLAILTALFYCYPNLQDRLIQAREQASFAARLNILRAILSGGLAVLLVAGLSWGVTGMLLAETLTALVLSAVAIFYLWPELGGRYQQAMLYGSLAYGLSILPTHFVGQAVPLITRSYLAHADSLVAVGLFGLAVRITRPLTLLLTAFQRAYDPVYFAIRKTGSSDGLETLAITVRNVWTAAVVCAVAGIWLGPPLVEIITPERFHAAADLLPILVLGFLGQTAFMLACPEIFYAKRPWLFTFVSTASGGVTVVLAIWLTREYGAVGMAWAIAGGFFVSAVMTAALSLSLKWIPYPWWSMMRATLCGAFVLAAWLLLPPLTLFGQFAAGLIALVVLSGMLWVTGDPTVRDVWRIAMQWSADND